MILLWGFVGDRPFDAVRAALERRSAPVVVVDQRRTLETSLSLSWDGRSEGCLEVAGEGVRMEDVGAVYWRTQDARHLSAVVEADQDIEGFPALRSAWALEEAMVAWLEVTDARVLNRPSDMLSNNSKPYQLGLLRALGFDVPDTLVTTDPAAARRFWTDRSAVIYKSVSGTRSIVSQLGTEHLDRLDQIAWCPTQFQQLVPGRDHRVHVVGDDVFATEVVAEADDYRYADGVELRAVTLPDDVAERCVRAARELGLPFAGIDLRRAPDDRWFCFEVNPSPGFTYYEAHTGQPIADAVASLLASAQSDRT